MTAQAEAEFAYLDYRMRGRAGGARPGKHAARQGGQGGDFRAYRPFWQLPDAARIDVRRSITDPFGDVLVRQMQQRSALTLMLAADVSRSMAPSAARSRIADLAVLAQAACRSALRAGDAFGFLAFDRTVRADLSRPPGRQRNTGQQIEAALQGFEPEGRGAEGILALAAHLPATRCLVLLASDFLMPFETIEAALVLLSRHDVAPIVLGAPRPADLPRAGLLRVRDAETGRTRLLLMRPALHRRWRDAARARQDALETLFRHHGRTAFTASAKLDLAALSQHLLGG